MMYTQKFLAAFMTFAHAHFVDERCFYFSPMSFQKPVSPGFANRTIVWVINKHSGSILED